MMSTTHDGFVDEPEAAARIPFITTGKFDALLKRTCPEPPAEAMLPTVLVLMIPPLSITNPPPGVALMSETLI